VRHIVCFFFPQNPPLARVYHSDATFGRVVSSQKRMNHMHLGRKTLRSIPTPLGSNTPTVINKFPPNAKKPPHFCRLLSLSCREVSPAVPSWSLAVQPGGTRPQAVPDCPQVVRSVPDCPHSVPSVLAVLGTIPFAPSSSMLRYYTTRNADFHYKSLPHALINSLPNRPHDTGHYPAHSSPELK